jgi:hypothetical protein
MPARTDPAAELAAKMVRVLQAQRTLGPDSYPLTLRRLAELTDADASAELVQKAAGKKQPFGERVLLAQAKSLDAPVALTEDADRLDASPLLLEFVLSSLCTPDSPTCDVAKLKSKVAAKLKAPFDAAVRRQSAAIRWTASTPSCGTVSSAPLWHGLLTKGLLTSYPASSSAPPRRRSL